MRIAFVMDPHFSGNLFWSKLDALDEVMKSNVDLVCIGGDLAHNARLGDGVMNTMQMVGRLSQVLNVSKPVILLEGNHDIFGSRGSSLDYFHLPNLSKVANQPQYFGFSDTEIVCVPWIQGRHSWKEEVLGYLNSLKSTKYHRILVGHMNIKDAHQNKNFRVNPDDHFVFSVDDLKHTSFAPTDLICGHLHMQQKFEGIKGCYVGAMTQNNFGEEGNPQGFLIWDDGGYDFRELKAPKFFNTTEKDFEELDLKYDRVNYYKFETETPDKYAGLPNVKPVPYETEPLKTASAFNGQIDLNVLVKEYCDLTLGCQPDSDYMLEELNKISLSIARSQTGLDQVSTIQLDKFGPSKNELVQDYFCANFTTGLNAIVGRNGRGKSMLIESLLAGLYGSYVVRGALKNYCHGELWMELTAQGQDYVISHKPDPKGGLVADFNGEKCRTRTELSTRIVPIFGEPKVFSSVVFMDQSGENDLVKAGEAKRLEILSKLLNLEILESYREEYADKVKNTKNRLRLLEVAQEREGEKIATVERLTEALRGLEVPSTAAINQLKSELEERRKNEALYQRYAEWKEIDSWLQRHTNQWELQSLILERKERIQVLDADIGSLRRALNQQGIGCAPDFLPCSLLRGANAAKLKALEELRSEIPDISETEMNVLAEQREYENQTRRHNTKREAAFDSMPEKPESTEVLSARLQLLTKEATHYKTIRSELDLAQEALRKVQEELRDLDSLKTALEAYTFLEKLCSKKGLPLYVISSIVNGLQQQLDEIVKMAEIDLRLKISLSKENDAEVADSFKILYSSRGRSFAEAKMASGGEGAMVRALFKLALMLYLNKYFGNYKVLVMDEPEAGLDSENMNTLLVLLRKLKGQLNQVIVVTHNEQIESIADKVIRVL